MKISNLKKKVDSFSVNIENMDIKCGKIHGLIGSNGCGKTTLIKLIAGILKPDSGEIDYGGITPREITMVPRKPYMLHDSVYNNLIYPLKIRKTKPDEGLVDYCLELAGLYGMRKKYAPSLSSGEQQKLALVRALIFSPKLLLLDEAFSGIDIEGIAKLERLIFDRQSADESTWLVVSHQLSHIQRICSYIFFMYGGSIDDEGSTSEIFTKPENERLKRYLQCETNNKI